MKKDNKRLLRHLAMIGVGFAGCYSAASQAALCEYIVDNEWNSGFVAGIRITNNTTTAVNGWEVSWTYAGDNRKTSGWNAVYSGNNPYTAKDSGWNGTISPGQKVEFGFQGTKGAGAAEVPTVTGAVCGGTPPGNLPPVAALTATPTTGTEPLVVAFDASGSTDPDGPASSLTYSWNFGDGSTSNVTSANPSYTYATAGSYTATVTVSDGTDVDTATATITVTGTGGGGNKSPVANATADKTRGPAPLLVKFDGSASSDPDMGPMPLSFDWSFGDGTTSTDISPSHTYTANGSYSVTLTVSDGEATSMTNLSIVVADQTARADNPFVGVKYYVDPGWSAKAAAEPGGSAISGFNTAVWMDRIGAITDGIGLRGHLDQALTQNAGMFMFVVYDLPNRDCAALASSGELRIADNGFNRYKAEYIAPIVSIISDPKYASINIVAIIEVDSLPNLVTNLSVADCAEADGPGGYRDGIRYALNQLATIPNVYNYVDIAHSGWLGWSDNFSAAVTLIGDVVASTDKGWGSVNGFVSNTSNYTPTVEPFLPDSNLSVGGMPVKSAKFYGYNNYTDEKTFVQDWRNAMIARGAPTTLGMLIDTARNGWGGAGRPTQVSKATNVDTYVNESKVDGRFHRGNWCNQPGGVGFKPWAAPYEGVDAFVWVKPPGESDGISDPNFTPDPNDPAKRHDPMCDPLASNRYDPSVTTGSMANAPHAGRWFPEQFQLLVANAYPAANEPAGPPPPPAPPRSDCPGLDPLAPVALTASGVKVTLDLGCKAPIYVSIGAAGANNFYVENSGDAYDVTVDVGGVVTPAAGYFTSVALNGATTVKVTRVDAAQSVIVRFD